MTYNETYTSADIDDIAIDGLGTFGAQAVTLMAIVALLFLYGWFRKKTR